MGLLKRLIEATSNLAIIDVPFIHDKGGPINEKLTPNKLRTQNFSNSMSRKGNCLRIISPTIENFWNTQQEIY